MIRPLVDGVAKGEVLYLGEPVSFWGGIDMDSGSIVDARHPQKGTSVSSRILVMAHGRGSSSSSSVLAEMARRGSAPAGIVLGTNDHMIVTGAVVARELYGTVMPVGLAGAEVLSGLRRAVAAEIMRGGSIRFH